MNVENYIREALKDHKIHLTLLDPEEQSPEEAVSIAIDAVSGGTDGIMLGGSTTNSTDLDATAKALKENVDVPIILFPGNITGVSKYADAIFFMSLLKVSWDHPVIENKIKTILTILDFIFSMIYCELFSK